MPPQRYRLTPHRSKLCLTITPSRMQQRYCRIDTNGQYTDNNTSDANNTDDPSNAINNATLRQSQLLRPVDCFHRRSQPNPIPQQCPSPAKLPYPRPSLRQQLNAKPGHLRSPWHPELAQQPATYSPDLSPHGDKHPAHHNKNPADIKKMTQLPPAAHAPLPPRKNTLANLCHQPHPSPAAWPCSVAWPRTITAPQTPTQTQLLCLVHAV